MNGGGLESPAEDYAKSSGGCRGSRSRLVAMACGDAPPGEMAGGHQRVHHGTPKESTRESTGESTRESTCTIS